MTPTCTILRADLAALLGWIHKRNGIDVETLQRLYRALDESAPESLKEEVTARQVVTTHPQDTSERDAAERAAGSSVSAPPPDLYDLIHCGCGVRPRPSDLLTKHGRLVCPLCHMYAHDAKLDDQQFAEWMRWSPWAPKLDFASASTEDGEREWHRPLSGGPT